MKHTLAGLSQPHSVLARRSLLTLIGASAAAGLFGCADASPEPAGDANQNDFSSPDPTPALEGEIQSTADAPSPADSTGIKTVKRIRKAYVPDFTIPPVQDGLAPVITRIPTQHPVVFLTIDDGATKTQEMVDLMTEYDYPATIFLARTFVQDNPAFFSKFGAQGSQIENHTLSHNLNMVQELGYAQQLNEITGMQSYIKERYGRVPKLFRPPGGAYSNVMRKAVADAGLRAIITWEAKANAGHMDYQVGNSLRPGDIVLMHFRPEFAADLAAFRQAQLAAGLEVILLEDFLNLNHGA